MDTPDRYDVEAMIRDATRSLVRDIELSDVRRELMREIDELRDEMRSLERTLQSRTAHLA